ncbi:restriction endonuclease subunit S [Thermoactinomyces sp. CICC 23799]|jgi:type I restriction enzyme, S subunit|uniref:restriction endonuclease subunit S n=1 Tax=Thermoactinomyces sp. CICC 23799 TaxID=2767429 RepID=UPI0018DBDF4D|nr:restriction endonuclease subunit S [Thermoactinomyces sp. CICC 23799]MBH8602043.1 restriction endonuclease subunit S [Thermoactinomyces sp. CICC 23799]
MSFEDWKEVELEEVIEFNPKESLKKGTIAKKVSMTDLEPFIRKIQGFTIEKVGGGSRFRNGDTLLARITPCLENGKTAYVDILDTNEVAFGSTEFIVMRAKPNITDNKFVYYLATSPFFREIAIKSMTGTSGRQRAQVSVLEKTTMKIPSLNEQKKIAETFSSLDEKIELNNQINKNLEEMAQAIFKSWFVDFEPFQDGEFVESELGLIPKGWEVRSLGEITTLIKDGTHNPPKRVEKGIPLITGVTIQNGFIDYQRMTYIKKEDYEKIHKKYQPEEGDILITKIGTLGKVAYVRKQDLPVAIHCNSALIRINREYLTNLYIYFLFKSTVFQTEFHKRKQQTVQEFINLKQIADIPILVPKKNVVLAFEQIIKPIFKQISLLFNQNLQLAKIRDTLLPKLMSGEIRVPL